MAKKYKKIVADTIIVILILSGALWIASIFFHPGKEYTNNAQVRQDIFNVSCRVQGFIKKVYFEEFKYVHKGDTLVLIEDSEFKLRLAQATADYQNALVDKSAMETTISTTENNMAVTDASIEEVRILLQSAETDYKRYKNLLEKGAVTRQQYDGEKTRYESLKAKLQTMERQKQSTKLTKDELTQRLDQKDAYIAVCQAAMDLAKLNLSYTVITAPCDGYTSRKMIQEGELMMPGKNLLSVVSDGEPWIVANYRETQMERIEVGSKVVIEVDAFPDVKFTGVVSAISDATGAQFSLVSPDNSTGNFVKTEQKVPVKISFDSSNDAEAVRSLRSGMNAECKILR